MENKDKEEMNTVLLALLTVLFTFVTFGGLFLNFMGIYTITKIRNKSRIFNDLMICLWLFDCWVLITAPFFFFGLYHKYFGCRLCALLLPYWAVPCGHMAAFGTLMMTLAITYERYLAVRDPTSYRVLTIDGEAQKKRLYLYIIPIIFVTILFNIPQFFAFKININSENNSSNLLLDLGCDKQYRLYYEFIATTCLFGIIPFSVLIFLSFKTIKILKRLNNRRQSQVALQDDVSKRPHLGKYRYEEKITRMNIVLVLLFLAAHAPRIVLSFIVGVTQARNQRCERKEHQDWPLDSFAMINLTSVLMVMINSSVGTFVYSAMNKEFRKKRFAGLFSHDGESHT